MHYGKPMDSQLQIQLYPSKYRFYRTILSLSGLLQATSMRSIAISFKQPTKWRHPHIHPIFLSKLPLNTRPRSIFFNRQQTSMAPCLKLLILMANKSIKKSNCIMKIRLMLFVSVFWRIIDQATGRSDSLISLRFSLWVIRRY